MLQNFKSRSYVNRRDIIMIIVMGICYNVFLLF